MAVLVFFALSFLVHVTHAVECPSGVPKDSNVTKHGTKCYEFVLHHRKDWADAAADCSKKGGNLVEIENMDEQNFIQSSLKSLHFIGKGVWIGLNDRVKEGQYEWSTDRCYSSRQPLCFRSSWETGYSPVTNNDVTCQILPKFSSEQDGNMLGNFSFWGRGQPGGFLTTNEDCVLLKYHESGHWHDYHCTDRFLSFPEHDGWICEYVGSQNTHVHASTVKPIVQTTNSPPSVSPTMTPSTMAVTTAPTTPAPPTAPTTPAPSTAPTTPEPPTVNAVSGTTDMNANIIG